MYLHKIHEDAVQFVYKTVKSVLSFLYYQKMAWASYVCMYYTVFFTVIIISLNKL